MDELAGKLERWLASHDHRLERFREPISLNNVGQETGEPPDRLRAFLAQTTTPPYHIWPHTYRGRTSRSKPYCLRLNGPGTVGLDWEDSIVGAVEAAFQRMSYQTAREIGTQEQLSRLLANPELSGLSSARNQRDFWALRRDGNEIDLYIVEVKGKEAYDFDYYCFAEALSQVFAVPAEPLSALLGAKKAAGRGLCWKYAQYLYDGWPSSGFKPTITAAILVPDWSPDVVWSGGKVRRIPGSFYSRPISTFRRFLADGVTAAKNETRKYERSFGEVMDSLESKYSIRALSRAEEGLRFRFLTTAWYGATREFGLIGL